MTQVFPSLVTSWKTRDTELILSPQRMNQWKSQLNTLYQAYVERFQSSPNAIPTTDMIPTVDTISWISHALGIIHHWPATNPPLALADLK